MSKKSLFFYKKKLLFFTKKSYFLLKKKLLFFAKKSTSRTPPNRKGNIRYALQRERDTIPRYDDEMTEGGRGSASQIYIRLVHSCTTPNILSGFNC